MHPAMRLRHQKRNRAIRLAAQYTGKLKRELPSCTALLYGSFARGDFNLGSDIDVVIISDHLPDNPLDQMTLLYRFVEGGIEPKGYTHREFLDMRDRGHPMIRDLLNEGIVLVDDGFWQALIGQGDAEHALGR